MRQVQRLCLLLFCFAPVLIAGCYKNHNHHAKLPDSKHQHLYTPQPFTPHSYQPLADQRNLIPAVEIDQDKINEGDIAFEKLFYAGKHIFSNRFTSEDHFGEGPTGPRRSVYKMADRENYPFLRFNGLDSQSCLECHLAIGFSSQHKSTGPNQVRFIKQPGITGGGAGFASNAFGLENFNCKDKDENNECETTKGVIRNPPHAFGAGYTQTLAEEMTWDLAKIREKAHANPGVVMKLVAKGVSFGEIAVDANNQIIEDKTNIVGVSEDLVVRPFQWKGIASNLRNFIRDAMNFHFSIQPTEFLAEKPGEDDMDDLKNEISEGQISAVAGFLALLRPPVESSKGLNERHVKKGKRLFKKIGCAECHIPKLPIDLPYVTVRDPRIDEGLAQKVEQFYKPSSKVSKLLSSQSKKRSFALTRRHKVTPSLEKYLFKKSILKKDRKEKLTNETIALELSKKLKGFVRNLNRQDGPPETLPRLPHHHGKVKVPLYSDLKRHNMGVGLSSGKGVTQTTDGGQEIPEEEFLTRPLWGVADTAPWMHDGRALTLTEAIEMHDSENSEGSDSAKNFKNLSKADQTKVITFLSSLRLPVF